MTRKKWQVHFDEISLDRTGTDRFIFDHPAAHGAYFLSRRVRTVWRGTVEFGTIVCQGRAEKAPADRDTALRLLCRLRCTKEFPGSCYFWQGGGVFFTPIAELGDRYVLLVRSGAQTVRVLTRLVHDWLPRRVYSFLVRCSRPILVRCHCCFIRGRLLRCDAVTITTRAGITSTVGTTGTDLPIIAQTAASMGQKEPPHNSPSLLTERIGTKASCTKAALVMTSTDVETEQSERHGVKIVLITASICKLNYWREHHSVGTLHYTLWEISLCRPKHIGLCMLKVCRACYFFATSGL